MAKVAIIGLGYVGLTLAVHLANKGTQVQGIEISEQILESLNSKKAHFFEDGFDSILAKCIERGLFEYSSEYAKIADADIIFLTLGTPLGSDGQVNLNPIVQSLRSLGHHAQPGALVALRSTVRVGTTRNIVEPELSKFDKEILIAYAPERTLEGKALQELEELPQVLAGIDSRSTNTLRDFFEGIGTQVVSLHTPEEAELAKLINNSERDLMFAFANEIALMCQLNGLNANRVIGAANFGYPRSNLKKPGPVGGPCLEKDPHILVGSFSQTPGLISLSASGRLVNEKMVELALSNAISKHGEKHKNTISKVAILGFAFKGNPPTSDLRGSLVFQIIDFVRRSLPRVSIQGHDYLADLSCVSGITQVETVEEAVSDADIVIFHNNHKDYAALDWQHLSKLSSINSLYFDFWNQIDAHRLSEKITYMPFGAAYGE